MPWRLRLYQFSHPDGLLQPVNPTQAESSESWTTLGTAARGVHPTVPPLVEDMDVVAPHSDWEPGTFGAHSGVIGGH